MSVVYLLLLIAGIGKAIDASVFLNELRTWVIIPPRIAPGIAVCLPALEIWAAIRWFRRPLGLAQPQQVLPGLVLYVCFTLGSCAELLATGAPKSCGCFGVWQRHLAVIDAMAFAICRNLACVVILCGFAMKKITPKEDSK